MRIYIDDCVVQFSVITKVLSSDSISLKDFVDWICSNVILKRTPNVIQFG